MLKHFTFYSCVSWLAVVGCVLPSETNDTDGADSTTSPAGDTSGSTSSGLESSVTSEAQSSSSTTSSSSPADPCPPGVGVDWTRTGAYLALASEEDFKIFGPQDLSCGIGRALDPAEFSALPLTTTEGALELTCEIPGGSGTSVVYLGVTVAEAVPSLEALTGLQDVSVLFHYTGPLEGKVDTGVDTVTFGVRDDTGPLFISQLLNCDGPFVSPSTACGFFLPPGSVSPTWSSPIPEPRLAPVGCGTRVWENEQAPVAGPYDLSRLAVRFETDVGVVDALDHHVTPLSIEGETYEFFAIEVVGEVEDPAEVFDSTSYSGSIRFLMIREP